MMLGRTDSDEKALFGTVSGIFRLATSWHLEPMAPQGRVSKRPFESDIVIIPSDIRPWVGLRDKD